MKTISNAILSICLLLGTSALGEDRFVSGESELEFSDGQKILLYIPASAISNPAETKLLFSIHGYTGRKFDKAGLGSLSRARSRWNAYAERHNFVVVSPHFDEKRFKGFNAPGLNKLRPDLRLIEIRTLVGRISPQFDFKKFFVFGFSGGGQFAHRFTILHPELVERVVIGAPGWYWLPNAEIPFPVGMKDLGWSGTTVQEADWDGFAKTRSLVLVGERDMRQGSFRETFGDIDLIKIQGGGRVVRARNWVKAIKAKWPDAEINIATIAKTEHSIPHEMKKKAIEFLFGE